MKKSFSDQILDHSAVMRYETLQAGVTERCYDQMCSDLHRLDNPQLLALLNWYKEVRNEEYKEVERIRSYVPAYVWEGYRLNPPPRKLNEQKLLEKAQKKLRERWLVRPLFKRKRVRNEQATNNESSGEKAS